MQDQIIFYKDTEQNAGKSPLSTTIGRMEWDSEREYQLIVEFFKGGAYEYKVDQIPCPYADAEKYGYTYNDYYASPSLFPRTIDEIWEQLKEGAKWSKADAEKGEMGRRSVGAAFAVLIKKPAGYNRKLYRKVVDNA